MINNIIKRLLVGSLPSRHIDVQVDSLSSDCLTLKLLKLIVTMLILLLHTMIFTITESTKKIQSIRL